MSKDLNHFTCIVAGDNPEKLLEKYDSNNDCEPTVVYKYSDAGKLKQHYINLYKEILEVNNFRNFTRREVEETIESIEEQSDTEFFLSLTRDYEHDSQTGDAITRKNPNGKWEYSNVGKTLSKPFITLEGKEVYQAKKCDIDWTKIHLANQDIYRRAWEMVMEGDTPKTDEEKVIYENMKNMESYFERYGDKKTYVLANSAFWGYAFCSEKGWFELEPNVSQFVWVMEFFTKYIDSLPEDTLLTVYECIRDK